jgi:hypothetical protein
MIREILGAVIHPKTQAAPHQAPASRTVR